jgi:hypothetical protein
VTGLRVAPKLVLPVDAVTETFAVLGRRGSGKTYTAGVLVEELLDAGHQVVIIDPLDVWWGLRASADGRGDGYPVTIFGGQKQDAPLVETAGALLADVVIEHGVSAIFSLRHLSKSAARRFVGDLAERLYERKGDTRFRTPLHLVVDEADAFVGQRIESGGERCYGAIDTIVRRGRSSGFGTTLISQRPAVIAKDVLTQTEVLVAHQTTGPQDRKALEAWIEAHDTEGRKGDFLTSLAGLSRGTAWFWSPGLLDLFVKVAVREKRTFDSSQTPRGGARPPEPKRMTAVDLKALESRIQATVEQAKANDPKALRADVVRLKAELAKRPTAPATVPKVVERPVLKDGHVKRMEAVVQRLAEVSATVAEVVRAIAEPLAALQGRAVAPVAAPRAAPARSQPAPAPRRSDSLAARGPLNGDAGDLTGPEQRILDAAAWLENTLGATDHEETAVAFMAGYTVGGGAFNNPRGALRTRGLISYPGPGRIALTATGRARARPPEAAATPQDLQARVLERLPGPEQKLLKVLLDAYPDAVTNEDLAQKTGYSPDGGAFNNPRGRLRTLGLLTYPDRGMVRAAPVLFLEGARS